MRDGKTCSMSRRMDKRYNTVYEDFLRCHQDLVPIFNHIKRASRHLFFFDFSIFN